MLFVRVGSYQKALIMKNNKIVRVLNEGFAWLKPGERAFVYDMGREFLPPVDLNILLKDESFADALNVVEIKDNELGLKYKNGRFMHLLLPGRYAYWKEDAEFTFIIADLSKPQITEPINLSVLTHPDLQPYVRESIVEPHENALMYINGTFESILQPGVYRFWRNKIPVVIQRTDMRTLQLEMNGQEILTKDKATLRINFYARYRVVDIMKALRENKEYDKQLYGLLQIALREYIAGYTLDALLEKRNELADYVISIVSEKAKGLGVALSECGIRDIILPGDIKNIMNRVLIAEKEAQANVITRREETASTRSLLNTAKLMEENEMLFKLKEMEYVEKIAEKISSISVAGSTDLVGQLKQIFVPPKSK